MLVFFYYYYKLLFRIGITHVVIPNIVLNIFCVDIGIYITYRTAKRLRGIGFANWVLLLLFALPDDLCMADNSIYQYDLVSVCYGGAVSGVMAAP